MNLSQHDMTIAPPDSAPHYSWADLEAIADALSPPMPFASGIPVICNDMMPPWGWTLVCGKKRYESLRPKQIVSDQPNEASQ